jgi:hypothetical protein
VNDTTVGLAGDETYEVGGVRMARPFKILYYSIEQLGWDGGPRPPHLRPSITRPWPDAVDTQPETYVGPA